MSLVAAVVEFLEEGFNGILELCGKIRWCLIG